jgi:hypothetical protein
MKIEHGELKRQFEKTENQIYDCNTQTTAKSGFGEIE